MCCSWRARPRACRETELLPENSSTFKQHPRLVNIDHFVVEAYSKSAWPSTIKVTVPVPDASIPTAVTTPVPLVLAIRPGQFYQ